MGTKFPFIYHSQIVSRLCLSLKSWSMDTRLSVTNHIIRVIFYPLDKTEEYMFDEMYETIKSIQNESLKLISFLK